MAIRIVLRHAVEIETKKGVHRIDLKGYRFKTWTELNEIKQIWRECPNWRPVDSLFELGY